MQFHSFYKCAETSERERESGEKFWQNQAVTEHNDTNEEDLGWSEGPMVSGGHNGSPSASVNGSQGQFGTSSPDASQ